MVLCSQHWGSSPRSQCRAPSHSLTLQAACLFVTSLGTKGGRRWTWTGTRARIASCRFGLLKGFYGSWRELGKEHCSVPPIALISLSTPSKCFPLRNLTTGYATLPHIQRLVELSHPYTCRSSLHQVITFHLCCCELVCCGCSLCRISSV